MLLRTAGILVFLAFAGYATQAQAYIGAPVLLPSDPKAGQFLQIEVRAGVCDGFPGAENSAEVTRSGGEIHMLIPSIHDEADWCTLPFEIVYHFWIGSVPAGVYTLKVDRHYTPLFGQEVFESIGTIPFDVENQATSLVPIPATDDGSLACLVAFLACAGVAAARRSTYRSRPVGNFLHENQNSPSVTHWLSRFLSP